MQNANVRGPDRETGLRQGVAEKLRRPGVEVMVDVGGRINALGAPVVDRNAEEQAPSGPELRPQPGQHTDRVWNVFERVMRHDHVGDPVRDPVERGKALDAERGGGAKRRGIQVDADAARARDRREQKSSAAAEIEDGVTRPDVRGELRRHRRGMCRAALALPAEIACAAFTAVVL